MFHNQSSRLYNPRCKRGALCSPLELRHYKPCSFQLFLSFSVSPDYFQIDGKGTESSSIFMKIYLCKSGLENKSDKLNYTKTVSLRTTQLK